LLDKMVLGDPGGALPDTIVVDHGKMVTTVWSPDDQRLACEAWTTSIPIAAGSTRCALLTARSSSG